MEYLRNWLLQNNAIQLYEDILNYLGAPDCFDSQIIVDNAPTEIRVVAYPIKPAKPRNIKQNRLSHTVPPVTLLDVPPPFGELFEG